MTQTNETPPGRGKPTLAAGIFGLAFLLSLAMMLWSGWQLWRGEVLPVAVTGTGTQCAWIVQIDEPLQVEAAWKVLVHVPQLPVEATPLVAEVESIWRDIGKLPLDRQQPIVLCGLPENLVAVGANAQGQPQYALIRGQDQHALKQAKPQNQQHLGTDLAYRAAVERVGLGALHVYLPHAKTTETLKKLLSAPWLQEGADLADWLSIGLRLDPDRLRLHAHVGTGQAGAMWLKEHADVAELEDATQHLAGTAQSGAIMRMPLELLPKLPRDYGPDDPLWRALLDLHLQGPLTLFWQGFGPGRSAVETRTPLPLPPTLPHAQLNGWTLVATDAETLAAVQKVRQELTPDQTKVADRDRSRLLTRTQGWFTPQFQLDWVWTDAGLAAEAAWLR